jgi:hypothetical protein
VDRGATRDRRRRLSARPRRRERDGVDAEAARGGAGRDDEAELVREDEAGCPEAERSPVAPHRLVGRRRRGQEEEPGEQAAHSLPRLRRRGEGQGA